MRLALVFPIEVLEVEGRMDLAPGAVPAREAGGDGVDHYSANRTCSFTFTWRSKCEDANALMAKLASVSMYS